jgi:hypothetical protein
MTLPASYFSLTVIDENGQISLGKQFSGMQVLVKESEPGAWIDRTASAVSNNERCLHEAKASADLSAVLDWALIHPGTEENADEVMKRLKGLGV